MLRKRIVTVLTLNDGVLFRTRNFEPDYRYTLNFVDLWSIDEIVLLDITRPGEGSRQNFLDAVQSVAENCYVPLAAGGGIRTLDDIRQMLRAGADKVIINTAALDNPAFITEAAKVYGSQCIVVSIDAQKTPDGYVVKAGFGRTPTSWTPDQWAAEAVRAGAGEILITSIDRDGMLEGYDNRLNRLVSDAVQVPVLGCGGAGRWQDFVDGFEDGGLDAACTANIYHFTEPSIQSLKDYAASKGCLVRRDTAAQGAEDQENART